MYDTLSEGKRNKNNDHNREYTNIYIYISKGIDYEYN